MIRLLAHQLAWEARHSTSAAAGLATAAFLAGTVILPGIIQLVLGTIR